MLSILLDEHRSYLADRVRLSAFERAIAATVRPQDAVLDLGCGTGILGLIAARAGARVVYAIEQGPIIELARQIGRANGFDGRIVFIKELSTRARIPEKVDVIVADQIGGFGFEAGLEHYSDARERFLKPGGKMIPSGVDLCVAPIEARQFRDAVEFWARSPASFDFGPAIPIASNVGYPVTLAPHHLIAGPASTHLDLMSATPGPVRMEARFAAARNATVHGVGGWFVAQLSPGVTMSNSPLVPERLNRRNVFFPCEHPLEVRQDDEIQIAVRVLPGEKIAAWDVRVSGQGDTPGAEEPAPRGLRQSTLRGLLVSRADLGKTRPEFAPRLSKRGEARQVVLALCDGRRPLAEIEAEILRRFPSLFSSSGQAAEFVAGIVARNTE